MSEKHWIEFFFLDASAIVKLVIDEAGSNEVRALLGRGSCKATRISLYEAYGVIKRKWNKGEITNKRYFNAMYLLSSYIGNELIGVEETSLDNAEDFKESEELVGKYLDIKGKHLIDLADALQIISMKKGFYKILAGESRPVLITADENLGKVAEKEGLRVRVIRG